VTREEKWDVGRFTKPDESIWVLVHVPRSGALAVEYFVLTGADLHLIQKPRHEEEQQKRKDRRAWSDYVDWRVSRDEVASFNESWNTVTAALGMPRQDWG
jgi:hypothetical protein